MRMLLRTATAMLTASALAFAISPASAQVVTDYSNIEAPDLSSATNLRSNAAQARAAQLQYARQQELARQQAILRQQEMLRQRLLQQQTQPVTAQRQPVVAAGQVQIQPSQSVPTVAAQEQSVLLQPVQPGDEPQLMPVTPVSGATTPVRQASVLVNLEPERETASTPEVRYYDVATERAEQEKLATQATRTQYHTYAAPRYRYSSQFISVDQNPRVGPIRAAAQAIRNVRGATPVQAQVQPVQPIQPAPTFTAATTPIVAEPFKAPPPLVSQPVSGQQVQFVAPVQPTAPAMVAQPQPIQYTPVQYTPPAVVAGPATTTTAQPVPTTTLPVQTIAMNNGCGCGSCGCGGCGCGGCGDCGCGMVSTVSYGGGCDCGCCPTIAYSPVTSGCDVCARPSLASGQFGVQQYNQTWRPIIALRPQSPQAYLGQGILGQPKAYMPNQPVRNFFRWITP